MATSFARKMGRKAHGIAGLMQRESRKPWQPEVRGRSNIKPFYSPYRLIEPRPEGIERMLIGVNPGGDPKRPDTTTGPGYMDFLESIEPLNSFLDESWNGRGPGEANMQIGVANVFKSLYGDDEWEATLRSTSTFNVCPLRTRYARDIPQPVRNESTRWCVDMLVRLRPRAIICFAIFDRRGKPAPRSPWHVIDERFRINLTHEEDVTPDGPDKWPAFVLGGGIEGNELHGCEVVGIPHVSRNWNNQLMFAALRCYASSKTA